MFYNVTAYSSAALHVWASNPANVDRYVDWLNRSREIDHYAASVAPQDQWTEIETKPETLNCDEPHWDDFMAE